MRFPNQRIDPEELNLQMQKLEETVRKRLAAAEKKKKEQAEKKKKEQAKKRANEDY